MGLLNLRFGYFARGGAATVIDDRDSAYNKSRLNELTIFNRWFVQKRKYLRKFMPPDAAATRQSFEVLSDNTALGTDQLQRIADLEDGRFSIAVWDILKDLKNANANQIDSNRATLRELQSRTSKFQIQIFNIHDDEVPLTDLIIRSKTGDDAAFYLMENANRSRDALERWHARAGLAFEFAR